MGTWTLTCPSEGVYQGECSYSKEDGAFVLRCPTGVKELEPGCEIPGSNPGPKPWVTGRRYKYGCPYCGGSYQDMFFLSQHVHLAHSKEWEKWHRKRDEYLELSKASGNPQIGKLLEKCDFTKEMVKPKEYFERASFRTLCPECPKARCALCPSELACATRVIIGCKKGEFVEGKCRIGTERHVIYHRKA